MINREALKAQQEVLRDLGYYKGEIDGRWSRKSIEAKLAFERSGKFNPGIPNKGLPFDVRIRLPIGLALNSQGFLSLKDTPKSAVSDAKIAVQEVKPVQPALAKKEHKGTEVTIDLKDLAV